MGNTWFLSLTRQIVRSFGYLKKKKEELKIVVLLVLNIYYSHSLNASLTFQT